MIDDVAGETAKPAESGRRLDSWKEIASYLGRDVRTVQRWEAREGLPVHRQQHLKLGSVFAFTAEVDAWRASRDARPVETAARHIEPARGHAEPARRIATPAVAAAVVLAAALPLVGLTWRVSSSGESLPVKSLAVLPLEDRSQPPGDEYFADGLTEALIGRLSSIGGVRMISTPSIMQFKRSTKPVAEIAEALGVDAVVVGSVSRAGERVRIEAELVRGGTGEVLWGGAFDRTIEDVFALQSEIAMVLGGQIHARASFPARPAAVATPTVAADVSDAYLRARFHLNGWTRRADLDASIREFEAAIARDPAFAPAHAGLAAAYRTLGVTSAVAEPNVNIRPRVVAAATRALELDPGLAEAHRLLAMAHEQVYEWREAESRYRQALALDPNGAEVHLAYGGLLVHLGRTEEGLAYARRGRDLDPLWPRRTVDLAWILYHARQFEDASAQLRTVLAAQPDNATALWFLGFTLIDSGKLNEAIEILERLAVVWERNPAGLGVLARAYHLAGRTADARGIVEELERRAATAWVPAAVFVNAYSAVDSDRFFAALGRAYAERSNIVQFLKTHPMYDGRRSDPRFVELLRQVRLD